MYPLQALPGLNPIPSSAPSIAYNSTVVLTDGTPAPSSSSCWLPPLFTLVAVGCYTVVSST